MNGSTKEQVLAQTLLDDAIVELSQQFVCVEPDDLRAIAPTGETYLTICTGGVKAERGRQPAAFFSAEAAIADWMLHVHEHARQRGTGPGATLYWRIKPEIDTRTILLQEWHDGPRGRPGWYEETVFMIYSRFLISDKAVA